jgi:hypothetical protein
MQMKGVSTGDLVEVLHISTDASLRYEDRDPAFQLAMTRYHFFVTLRLSSLLSTNAEDVSLNHLCREL